MTNPCSNCSEKPGFQVQISHFPPKIGFLVSYASFSFENRIPPLNVPLQDAHVAVDVDVRDSSVWIIVAPVVPSCLLEQEEEGVAEQDGGSDLFFEIGNS